jgi:hypothetical protein
MFLVFPIPGESHETRELRLETYWDTIKDLPAAAVEVCATKVRVGSYDSLNRTFAPTTAEFANLVRREIDAGYKRESRGENRFRPLEPPILTHPILKARYEAELRMLPVDSRVNYEEAMILTNGKPTIGRFPS